MKYFINLLVIFCQAVVYILYTHLRRMNYQGVGLHGLKVLQKNGKMLL